jgi:hypothetical protein
MKFLTFAMFDIAKTDDIAQTADNVANTPGIKFLADYLCQGIPFPGVPPNMVVTISVSEAETNEAMSAAHYPVQLAGATIWSVPVLEIPIAGASEEEKKLRG